LALIWELMLFGNKIDLASVFALLREVISRPSEISEWEKLKGIPLFLFTYDLPCNTVALC